MPKFLSIAVNDYPGTGQPLRGCVNDSIAWSSWFKSCGWEIETLWNEAASGVRIRTAISRLMQEAQSGDRVALHFSGHGSQVFDSTGDEGDRLDECYCPWDVQENGPLTDDELFRLFQLRPAEVRLYLIADCCHSGSLHRGNEWKPSGADNPNRSDGFGGKPDLPAQETGLISNRAIEPNQVEAVRFLPLTQPAADHPNRRPSAVLRTAGLLLAACGEAERAREITREGKTQGVLTETALRTLQRLPPRATHREWLRAILRGLPQVAQTPRMLGNPRLLDEPVFGTN